MQFRWVFVEDFYSFGSLKVHFSFSDFTQPHFHRFALGFPNQIGEIQVFKSNDRSQIGQAKSFNRNRPKWNGNENCSVEIGSIKLFKCKTLKMKIVSVKIAITKQKCEKRNCTNEIPNSMSQFSRCWKKLAKINIYCVTNCLSLCFSSAADRTSVLLRPVLCGLIYIILFLLFLFRALFFIFFSFHPHFFSPYFYFICFFSLFCLMISLTLL